MIKKIEAIIREEALDTVKDALRAIGIVGMNAAIANAVFNATGKRIRELPIRAEKLI